MHCTCYTLIQIILHHDSSSDGFKTKSGYLSFFLAPSVAPVTPTGRDDRTRYETAAAAAVSESSVASDVVLVALEEASRAVDAALNATLERLFSPASQSKG